jgi:hypothetical protein
LWDKTKLNGEGLQSQRKVDKRPRSRDAPTHGRNDQKKTVGSFVVGYSFIEQTNGVNKASCTKSANADIKTKKRKLGQRPTRVFAKQGQD